MHIPPLHQVIDTVTATVTVASFACNFLPKSTVFDRYPRVKAAYETAIDFVSAFAANWRSCLPSLNKHIPGLGFEKPEDKK